MKCHRKMAFIVLAAGACIAFSAPSVSLVSISAGSWIVDPRDNDDFAYKTIPTQQSPVAFFNKIMVDVYGNYNGFKGYAGVPLQYSVQQATEVSESKTRFSLADVSLWVGYEFANIEPRLGIIIPAYADPGAADKAWVGSGSYMAQLGFGINSQLYNTDFFSYSFESMLSIALGGPQALVEAGGWQLLPIGKLGIKPWKKVKLATEILGTVKKQQWAAWKHEGEAVSELLVEVVGHINVEYFYNESMIFLAKAGWGPTFKDATIEKPSVSDLQWVGSAINIGINMQLYY